MSFPSSLDSYSTKNSGDTIAESHVNTLQTAIEAIEAKVGVDGSAVVTTHDYLLTHLPGQSQNWDAGAYEIRALTFESDATTGTAPFTIASTTVVSNLNVQYLNGKEAPTGDIVGLSDSQTLTNKTLTSPDINGGTWNGTIDSSWSAAGQTCSDLGTITTVDINGGTLDGVQIGGTTATGELIVNNASDDADGLGSQGTAGEVLTSAGAGANPTWAVPINTDAVIKAWINMNGSGTIAIRDSFNVSGITDLGTGQYRLTWDTDFANDDYAIAGITGQSFSTCIVGNDDTTVTTGYADVGCVSMDDAFGDRVVVCYMAIGDQ